MAAALYPATRKAMTDKSAESTKAHIGWMRPGLPVNMVSIREYGEAPQGNADRPSRPEISTAARRSFGSLRARARENLLQRGPRHIRRLQRHKPWPPALRVSLRPRSVCR